MRKFVKVLLAIAAVPVGLTVLDWLLMSATHPGAAHWLRYRGANNCAHNLPIVAGRIKTELNTSPGADLKTLVGRSYDCGGILGAGICRTTERNGIAGPHKMWYLRAIKTDDRWRVLWLCDTLIFGLNISPQNGTWQE